MLNSTIRPFVPIPFADLSASLRSNGSRGAKCVYDERMFREDGKNKSNNKNREIQGREASVAAGAAAETRTEEEYFRRMRDWHGENRTDEQVKKYLIKYFFFFAKRSFFAGAAERRCPCQEEAGGTHGQAEQQLQQDIRSRSREER